MGAKSFLFTGDLVIFISMDGNPLFIPTPPLPLIQGSSLLEVLGKTACIKGDETKVILPSYPYMTPSYPVPGVLSCRIKMLKDQLSTSITDQQKEILYIGTEFIAEYTVITPASLPAIPAPQFDLPPGKKYTGKGKFIQLIDMNVEED